MRIGGQEGGIDLLRYEFLAAFGRVLLRLIVRIVREPLSGGACNGQVVDEFDSGAHAIQ